jgi:HAD superfamily hydrolase (TIGR01450 family)
MDFKKFDTYVFDLDSTLWFWDRLIPGAKKVLKKLRKLDKKILFVTNNTIESRRDIAARLRKLGIDVKVDEVINAGITIGYYIKEKNGTALALNIGTEIDLLDAGVKVRHKPPVDFVVVTEDWDFDYEQLTLAVNAVDGGGKILTSIIGRKWQVGDKWIPGVGCWVKAVEFATGARAKVLGKPSAYMRKVVRQRIEDPKKCVFIGDELKSDIEFAKKMGCKTVFVKTGRKNEKGKVKPDLVLKSVKGLLRYI